jgi:hypothetical protein
MQAVMQRVHDIINHHLNAACNPNNALAPTSNPAALLGICASLRVLTALEPVAGQYVLKFTQHLVKLLNRVARDHASPGGLVLDPSRQPLGRTPRCASCAIWRALLVSFLNLVLWAG